jgi:hypothetical protein
MTRKPKKKAASGSVIPADYDYQPDDLAARVRKANFDGPSFIRFAKQNGVWDAKYDKLNAGMQRMNCLNKLRAKVRAGHKVIWLSGGGS